jgi:phosphoenolpyruvate synthase/pyruvate phosphate dikinase
MESYVLGFEQIDATKLALVGGKGANLGELSRIEGIRVPEGFCLTTDAYMEVTKRTHEFDPLLDRLDLLKVDDAQEIRDVSGQIRSALEATEIPSDIADEVARHLAEVGAENAYAVRSSATAEDLPTASFAGQQDTYLNVTGADAILKSIILCWASLFTERAVVYRIRNGFDHRKVLLSVLIQTMVLPEVSGIAFTADPVTSNRKVVAVDASFGIGEALVSGLVDPDTYTVRDDAIVEKRIATKKVAIYGLEAGGTEQRLLPPERQNAQALTDEQVLQLAAICRKIEAHFGHPQDIEWCLFVGDFYIVQSRPITTLYPIPGVQDGKNHVYLSFGHLQMMTDAMKPFGLSFFQLQSGQTPLIGAGGRFYGDLSADLASPVGRRLAFASMGAVDPLMLDAIKALAKRKSFMKGLAHGGKKFLAVGSGYFTWQLPVQAIKAYRTNDAAIVEDLMSQNEAALRDLRERFEGLSGDGLFAGILNDLEELKEAAAGPRSMGVVFAGQFALRGVNKNMEKWLGEKGVAESLTRSVANNVTSEMGLALLDVADVVRRYPTVMDGLQRAKDDAFFEDLAGMEGGAEVGRAMHAFLDRYGMRCPGELDITKPRWSEQPTALVPMILSDIRNFAPGASKAVFEEGRLESERTERELLSRLKKLHGGRSKVRKARKRIGVLRNFAGYREYPKYLMMQHYWIIKQALLREAAKLVEERAIREKEDVAYLTFEELRDVVRTRRLDQSVIDKRKEEFEVYEKLTPPRVITSDGEVVSGAYHRSGIPAGALVGIAASAGTVEGRARVITRIEDADIEEGDILVTTYTDPSWTPVFVSVRAIVAEVGGMTTHGAVVAREYGLPAVVAVEDATKLIKDGQRIRVNGTEGYVEVLPGS